jgi:hypothetical protein
MFGDMAAIRGRHRVSDLQHMLYLAFRSICCYASASGGTPNLEAEMAITIRNKALEAEIKAIGARLNKGPTDVLKQLVEEHALLAAERQRLAEVAMIAKRTAAMKKLMAELPVFTDEQKREMDRRMNDMYDENGLPQY